MGKVFQWLADKVLVDFLANNRTFQRAVLKFDNFMQSSKKSIMEQGEKVQKTGQEVLKNKQSEKGSLKIGDFDVNEFMTTFREEMKKEFGEAGKETAKKK
jgi:lipoate-protein ligase A